MSSILRLHLKLACVVVLILFPARGAAGQELPSDDILRLAAAESGQRQNVAARSSPGPSYILGPNDTISVRVLEAEEISPEPVRIGSNGEINLPLVGRCRAAGLTTEQLEAELARRLSVYIREPQVAVSVSEFLSQPVSVIGAVHQPGVHHLRGPQTLVEILSMAGGLLPDAGDKIKITRRQEWGRIPLASAVDEADREFSVAEVSLREIMTAANPTDNIVIQPHDVISVPRAELVYVVGSVIRAGGFVLKDRENMSVLEALSLAGGLEPTAASKKARILRASAGSTERTESGVNLKKILDGKETEDVFLYAGDILFVPDSQGKRAATKGIDTAIRLGTLAIWRF